ncbi:MAG TPA: zinc-binding dehydrogenase [Ktedonobacteraceae bacterium]|nr:zinc-binding dehydrogenase [Ktedonobacteraceae bacterium]
MQAMVFIQFGGPEELVLTEIPTPVPENGEVLIKVKALGINRAEVYMRMGLFGEVTPVSGIECVGQVEYDPSGTLYSGQTVATITGGMGRTRNGSYAEYTCVPIQNVYPLETDLDWATLAAIPESYATAWSCLFANLRISAGQVLFVRGGTSALGQAAINIAKQEGVTVLTSTRSAIKVALLTELGAERVLIENGNLSEEVRAFYPDGIDGVLDIIGNSTLLDSLRMARKGGRVCVAGFLGSSEPVAFSWLANMPFGVDLNAFASLFFGTKDFPHSDVPMQKIVDRVANGIYKSKPVKVFPFEHIPEAHRLMESNSANGKIVVVR